MTLDDVRAGGGRLIARVRALPLAATLAAATVALVVAIFAFFDLSGPRYAVLFDGLSPAQGGQVIGALQKDGIPYQLSADGNVISVPATDLGRARLQLGMEGAPQSGTDSSWKALEGASVTTSAAAEDALHLQAVEQSLEAQIRTLSGAARVQVMLALPKDTPFLADQAKAKASVVLSAPASPDEALGLAVAQIVSAGVPGLDTGSVVVALRGGTVLYPISSSGDIADQLAIVKRIEAAQEAKIRALLVPVVGAANARVSVTADVSFATKKVQSVTYGPHSETASSDTDHEMTQGEKPVAQGIPGALSNQPPGPTTAPVTPPAQGQSQPPSPPQSTSEHDKKTFDVDTTSATEEPAAWHVGAISVSVVVDKSALGSTSIADLKALVASTLAVPGGHVDVTTASFVSSGGAVAGSPEAQVMLIGQAGLWFLAALGLLLGAVLPLTRWLRALGLRPPAPVAAPRAEAPRVEPALRPTPGDDHLRTIAAQLGEVGLARPDALAAILQRWIATDAAEMQAEDPT